MVKYENLPVAINRRDWSYRRIGPQNERRHNEKIKEAIKDNLPHIISDNSIITADPKTKKPVKVPIRSLELPRIKYKRGKEGVGAGGGDEQVGDMIDYQPGNQRNKGSAGDKPGIEYYEAEFTIDEIKDIVFEDLGLPNLMPKKRQEITTDEVIFDEIRKKRSFNNLDLQRTIFANMKRNAEEKRKAVIDKISPEDLRVKTWREIKREENSAVIFLMADISGSMGDFEKYITKAFSWWTVEFLRNKYPKVNISFIAHDTEAHEVDEEHFFKRGNGGGTKCSSANELALKLIDKHFPPDQYNIYLLHFSDGDNLNDDNKTCVNLVKNMLDLNINQYAFVQIGRSNMSSLKQEYERSIHDGRFTTVQINNKQDVFEGLRKVFPPESGQNN